MGVVYLAGSRSGAGVTAVALGLAATSRAAGRSVSLVKPISSPGDPDPAYFGALGGTADTATLDGAPTPERLGEAARIVETLKGTSDVVIVEGPSLADADGASAMLAERLGAPVVGVVPYDRSLGGSSLRDAWQGAYRSLFAGCLVNKRTLYCSHDASERLLPELAADGVPVFGALPEDRLLLAPTVRQVAEHLEGTYFTDADGGSELIEHFLIGGLVMEWGGYYFGRFPNQAVLVRGGRIDIQMAALNFPLNALILTSCETPSQYVHQRAEELDVPLIAVRQNTHEAAAALESLGALVSVHHAAKAERAAELLNTHADMSALSAVLSN